MIREDIPSFMNNEEELNKEAKEVFDTYITHLDLTKEDLKKKILDIGSAQNLFAKWVQDKKLGEQVTGIDFQWLPAKETNAVIGQADALPFKDNSFELVLANHSVPVVYQWEKKKDVQELIRQTLIEIIRVLKPDGEIRMYPLPHLNYNEGVGQKLRKNFDQVINDLQKKGLISFEVKDSMRRIHEGDGTSHYEPVSLIKIQKL